MAPGALCRLARAPPGGATTDVADYLVAAGELLVLTMIVCWALTLIFNREAVSRNRLKDFLGYNNACVGWDFPPASYAGLVGCVGVAYLATRYNHLDATRTRLLQGTEQGVSRRLYRFILATNLLYALSCWIFPLLFLLGPPDGRWGWHCLCFMQLVVARFLAILGNFLEEPGSLTTGQKVFIWVYGALSVAFPTLVAVAYFIYESQEHSCDEPPCQVRPSL